MLYSCRTQLRRGRFVLQRTAIRNASPVKRTRRIRGGNPAICHTLAGLLLIVLTGCASERAATVRPTSPATREVAQRLRAETQRWNGTPHQWGGLSRQGVDCSGLIYLFYDKLFGLRLPRTTAEQIRVGSEVAQRELQAGDLVFFRPSPKTRHAGIYLTDGEFVHASSTEGVTISHLDTAYWRRRYWTARRVLDSTLSSAPSPSFTEPRPEQSTARTGW